MTISTWLAARGGDQQLRVWQQRRLRHARALELRLEARSVLRQTVRRRRHVRERQLPDLFEDLDALRNVGEVPSEAIMSIQKNRSTDQRIEEQTKE